MARGTQEIQALCDAAAIAVGVLADEARDKRDAASSRMATDVMQIANAAFQLRLRHRIETLCQSRHPARIARVGKERAA